MNEETIATPEEKKDETVTVIDVRFRDQQKTYYFDPGTFSVRSGDAVVVNTSRGTDLGFCARGSHSLPVKEVPQPLRPVIRLASQRDQAIYRDNLAKERGAVAVCQEKANALGLDMQVVSAEYAFDGSKLVFNFTADGRVDFRELVKDLAFHFHIRIELRQIGVRDKAKLVGGLGCCGRPFCCREFLDDFQPVSIKMAKTQNLSLNPTKISGTCGRLMCCLKYEEDAYQELNRTSPKAESLVDTADGRGTVVDVNLLKQSVRVRMEDEPETINTYRNCDICVLRNGKAKKTDPPIPKDVAPLSSKPKAAPSEDPMPELRMKQTPAEPVKKNGEEHRQHKKPAAPKAADGASGSDAPKNANRHYPRRRHRPSGGGKQQ